MTISVRALTIAAATVLLATAAQAQAVKGAGFSAVFPCRSKLTTQNLAAGKDIIPVASYDCQSGGAVFYVVTSTYPKGFIAKKTLAGAFKDAVGGAAANVMGVVKSDTPIRLGKVPGHDVLIDVPTKKAAVHLRVFFVGDVQFQVMVVGAKGAETSKPVMDFMGSFRLGT
ncbi:MAG TPA: hypothetical protein VMU01_12520 [Rhizomicrobium sp.]|nr:hypothetical protein [Rhizomicrobium sp.]